MIRNVRNFVTRLRVQDLVVNTGLDEIAKYADAIGPWKETIAPGSGTNLSINYTTNLVDRCGDPGTAAPSLVTGSAALPNRLVILLFCLLLQGARSWPAGAPIHVPQ